MLTTTTMGRSSMLLRASIAAGAALGVLIVLMTLLHYPASPSHAKVQTRRARSEAASGRTWYNAHSYG